ncbi:GGDEF domain-containing phosphodiesterase [Alkalimarinus alittae]|uniref:EAL domain-containing protein n=1 Tax=Alkalimarinus alittae TaxID=2961619 RepID=A0ABY6N3F1_9ALTE|nr:GGDEF domain-containing phosphodiesterase [Alkalimarinus alittae]UZE96635.1 EAL domain-containing protein [Alkalimarinus alittae]
MAGPTERHSSPELRLMAEFSAPKRSAILLHQIKASYHESLPLFIASICCAILVTLFLWDEQVSHTLLLGWLASTCLVSLLQIGIHTRFKTRSKQTFSYDSWHNLLLIGSLLNGAHWGFAALTMLPENVGVTQLIALSSVAALMVFATTAFTMNIKAFLCFALPPFLSLTIHTLLSFDRYGFAFIFVVIMFAGFVTYSAYRHYKNRERMLIKELENDALINYLDNGRRVAEELNEQLTNEIISREEAERQLLSSQKTLELNVQQRTQDLTLTNERLNQQVALRKSISDALVKSQTRLSQAIEASQLGLWDWDLTSGTVYQSAFHEAFKQRELSSVDFIGNLKKVIHPQDYPSAKQALSEYLKRESDSYQVQYRIKQGDNWLWVEESGKAVKFDNSGDPIRMLGTRRNINAEKKRDEQVRLAKSVFDHTSEGVFVLDANFCFISVNAAFCEITGYSKQDLEGRYFIDLSSTPKKFKVFNQAKDEISHTGQWQAEIFEKRKDGNYFPAWIQINSITNGYDEVEYYAGLLSDISARKDADEKLTYLLNYDDLTGLANRSLFKDRLHNAITKARKAGKKYCLIMVDIDRFKQINDSLGHEIGDYLLKEVSQRISNAIRNADTIARLSSDEFAILIEYDTKEDVHEKAKDILKSLSAPFFVDVNELLISCSIGISKLPKDSLELQPLMQQAAMATQQAKYLGGNNIQFYNVALQNQTQYHMEIEGDLRKAMQNHELEVFFQPKVNVHTKRIESAEALVRWRHPSRGLISPSEFIHIAEDSGLIAEIGKFVLLKSCQQAKKWADDDIATITVSVNVSAHQLRHENLPQAVGDVLKRTKLPENQLELELTESALMENLSAATALLTKLCALGVSISLDDFGTGYSSLSHLKLFPVDALKIDRSFIRDITSKQEDEAIVNAIIVLGHSLNLKVIAEGVENIKQLELLERLGCDEIQGYFIAKPLSAADMTHMLKQQTEFTSLDL